MFPLKFRVKKKILHLTNKSSQGLYAKELSEKLKIACYAVVNHMINNGMIDRFSTKKGVTVHGGITFPNKNSHKNYL